MKFYQGKYPVSDNAEYVIDYVYDNPTGCNFYYQIVRLSDEAILYANPDIKNVKIRCWKLGIPANKVSLI